MGTVRGIPNCQNPGVLNENVMMTDSWLDFVAAGEGGEYLRPDLFPMEALLARFDDFDRRLQIVMRNQDALIRILERNDPYDPSGRMSLDCARAAGSFPDPRSKDPAKRDRARKIFLSTTKIAGGPIARGWIFLTRCLRSSFLVTTLEKRI